MTIEQAVTIRSYRLAFALERRIFRIERYRLPLPYGLPLRGLAYAALALVLVLACERVAGVGVLVAAVPWPVRYLVIPAGAAQLLLGVRVDGRPAHQALVAWAGVQLAVVRRAGQSGRLRLEDVVLAPDERDPAFRAAVVAGPGVVILRRPARLQARRAGRELRVRPERGRSARQGVRVKLKRGQRMRVQR